MSHANMEATVLGGPVRTLYQTVLLPLLRFTPHRDFGTLALFDGGGVATSAATPVSAASLTTSCAVLGAQTFPRITTAAMTGAATATTPRTACCRSSDRSGPKATRSAMTAGAAGVMV